MANDRMKSLRKRMQEVREQNMTQAKGITFILPEMVGPKGNVVWLTDEAERLMFEAGISEDVRSQFKSQAMRGQDGTYDALDTVVKTIAEWFTCAVPVVKWEPLDDVDQYLADIRAKRNSEIVDETAEAEALANARAAQPVAVTEDGQLVYKKGSVLVNAEGKPLTEEDLIGKKDVATVTTAAPDESEVAP